MSMAYVANEPMLMSMGCVATHGRVDMNNLHCHLRPWVLHLSSNVTESYDGVCGPCNSRGLS